jgi:hypothetical protein
MNSLDQLVAEIRRQDILQSEESLSDWLVRAELELVSWDQFPPTLFQALLELFRSDASLSHDSSWKLLHFLQGNFELLIHQQKEELVSFLVEAFPELIQWMPAFVAAEILGSWYADDNAGLSVLETLVSKTQPPVVACIPHGLEIIARQTRSEMIRGKAVRALEALRMHPSDLVRQEAAISLDKVKRT